MPVNGKYKTNLVGYGEKVSLLIGELDSCLGDWLHGAGHVVIPGEGDSESHDGQGAHDDRTHMVTLHSPLSLLGELGSLYQFILLCHDDGFWKWSGWVTWGLWSGLVTCTNVLCSGVITGDWAGRRQWTGRPGTGVITAWFWAKLGHMERWRLGPGPGEGSEKRMGASPGVVCGWWGRY